MTKCFIKKKGRQNCAYFRFPQTPKWNKINILFIKTSYIVASRYLQGGRDSLINNMGRKLITLMVPYYFKCVSDFTFLTQKAIKSVFTIGGTISLIGICGSPKKYKSRCDPQFRHKRSFVNFGLVTLLLRRRFGLIIT